jgi:2-keto-4-pentenoate hydratase/2-oxohepta-3-ene-1,7-dioic acid hydratase in catechol pathway
MSLVRFVSQVDPTNLQIVTKLNDEVVQDGNTNDMIFPVAEIISYLSQVWACMQSKMSRVASLVCVACCVQGMTLLPGTVILTGTPEVSAGSHSGLL